MWQNAVKEKLADMKRIYKNIKEKEVDKDIAEWSGLPHRTLLMEASCCGRPDILRWLIYDLEYDVNELDKDGNTALHFATLFDKMECARFLLAQGSQQLKNRSGIAPLDYAKSGGNEELQKLLEAHLH